MKDISIVIVNYNVKHFIEQCLHSVQNAIKNINAEIIVVDNNSVDGSAGMIQDKFPSVNLIVNTTNKGFSKANNQAIKIANSQYVLLLNPDTVVQEDTFTKCIQFMNENPNAGGLGVKMIDGKGNFLPESKRSLPTPKVSFYKIFGLAALFPKSKIFGKYHLGYLNKNQTHKVDVLSGAFMLLRTEALNKVGLLDEDYFMYGEDIDLSYRLILGGYDNYYFANTTIIHYKGESTKKGSINYVIIFYKAMAIFAQKHFSAKNAKLLNILIHFAIWLRASLAIFKRITNKIFVPLLDGIVISLIFQSLTTAWAQYRYHSTDYYPEALHTIYIPIYIAIWLFFIYMSGGYDKPIKIGKSFRGVALGTIFILIVYSLLPENLRFSRFIIFVGVITAMFSIALNRLILHFTQHKNFKLYSPERKKIAIIGEMDEAQRVKKLLEHNKIEHEFIGFINPKNDNNNQYIGKISQLEEIVNINNLQEIIFCAKEVSNQLIIENMLLLSKLDIEFKIAPPESHTIIGSNSINTKGEFYSISLNAISSSQNRRIKRIFDITTAVVVLVTLPVTFLLINNLKKTIVNVFEVIIGAKTWVGYFQTDNKHLLGLPKIREHIYLPIIHQNEVCELSESQKNNINLDYAQNYNYLLDFKIVLKSTFALFS